MVLVYCHYTKVDASRCVLALTGCEKRPRNYTLDTTPSWALAFIFHPELLFPSYNNILSLSLSVQ